MRRLKLAWHRLWWSHHRSRYMDNCTFGDLNHRNLNRHWKKIVLHQDGIDRNRLKR